MPPLSNQLPSRAPIEVRRRDQADHDLIDSRLPGVEDIGEDHRDWLEWVEFIDICLEQQGPEGLRGVGPVVLYDRDGVVTVPRWYIDEYLSGVVPA